MSNKIKAILFFLLFPLIIFSCRNNNEKTGEMEKLINSEKITEAKPKFFSNDTFSVVRVEKYRVFVCIPDSLVNKIKVIRSIINTVKLNYPFDRLGISFFSDQEYAGYKTEYIDDSSAIRKWAYSYIGEFSLQEKEYWTYPLFPHLKVKYIID